MSGSFRIRVRTECVVARLTCTRNLPSCLFFGIRIWQIQLYKDAVSHLAKLCPWEHRKLFGTACPQKCHNASAKATPRNDSLETKPRQSDTHLSSTSTFPPSIIAFSNRLAREPRSSFATSTAPLHTYRSPCSSGTLRLHVAFSSHKVGCVMGMPEEKSSASCRARVNLMKALATVDTVKVILSGDGGGELIEVVGAEERGQPGRADDLVESNK